jgi:8-amino-7-oxononanoate synthase
MSRRVPSSLVNALRLRTEEGSLRSLAPVVHGIDLCSNDYLGLARRLGEVCATPPEGLASLGATGSRLVSGSTVAHEELEEFLACFHSTEAALLFGSGFEANLGVLGSLGGRNDTVLYDELVHASMRDGIRLSLARSYSFRHNDLDDLRRKIALAKGDCFIAVESVYSMDGDFAPLEELCALCKATGAHLIVDEAHATGVFGEQGEGLVQAAGLADSVFARIHTFGKALGYRGACVVGSFELKEFLVNFARPFVYSTAVDLFSLQCIRRAYELMATARAERSALRQLVATWRELTAGYPHVSFMQSDTPIQGVLVSGNRAAVSLEHELRSAGLFVRAIRSPAVPVGQERLRVCLHSFNRIPQLGELISFVEQRLGARGAVCATAV